MPGVNSGSRHGGRFLGFIVGGGCREIRYRGERKGEAVGTTKIRQDRHEFSLPDSRSLPQLNFEGGRITIAREVNEMVSPPLRVSGTCTRAVKNHAAVAIASTAVATAIGRLQSLIAKPTTSHLGKSPGSETAGRIKRRRITVDLCSKRRGRKRREG
ncbi:hypothetical protein ALC62_06165 [Cyphomyrmex costatus]|uniref:Uncharacterized protein n=1 Tax=Cyphomyrmex costatus TaxID=456900 RepID=A0A195CQZ9_9HYME|nr:hypothetical protein ALC62_06165 [Cyphomyrmex costatus]